MEAPFPVPSLRMASGSTLRFAVKVWLEADRLTREALELVEDYLKEKVDGAASVHPAVFPYVKIYQLTETTRFANPSPFPPALLAL